MKFGFDWPSSFGEDILKVWTTLDHGYTISSTGEPAAQVSKTTATRSKAVRITGIIKPDRQLLKKKNTTHKNRRTWI